MYLSILLMHSGIKKGKNLCNGFIKTSEAEINVFSSL